MNHFSFVIKTIIKNKNLFCIKNQIFSVNNPVKVGNAYWSHFTGFQKIFKNWEFGFSAYYCHRNQKHSIAYQNMNHSFWSNCFGCFLSPGPKTETFEFDDNDPGEYLVEKLMIHRVPLRMFATPAELEKSNLKSERSAKKETPSYFAMHERASDVRFFSNRKPSYPPDEDSDERPQRKPPQKSIKKPQKSTTSLSNRRGEVDAQNNRDNRSHEIISTLSQHRPISADFLNQYSSVFTYNLKDPIPKDPNPVNPSQKVKKKPLKIPVKQYEPALVVKKKGQAEVSSYTAAQTRKVSRDSDESEEDQRKRKPRKYETRYVLPDESDEEELGSENEEIRKPQWKITIRRRKSQDDEAIGTQTKIDDGIISDKS